MGYLSLMLLAEGVVTAQAGKIVFKHKHVKMEFCLSGHPVTLVAKQIAQRS